jgi:UDP-glucose 4-epimerase
MMKLLITGGAGYIGSHVVKALGKRGHQLTIVDNLSTGHKEAISFGELVQMDISDTQKLDQLFSDKKFDGVLHFAGSIEVPESVANPIKYYSNNTFNSFNLIKLCLKHKVHRLVFSSTAAVYGDLPNGIASEDLHTIPVNPYGSSKLMTESMLKDVSAASDFRYIAFRYFNVAGADVEGKIGCAYPNATNLIKVAVEVATGKREKISLFGTDYSTPDGTCIRDFIHVDDLAFAHVLGIEYLEKNPHSHILNCGYGKGYSVKEVLDLVPKIAGHQINIEIAPRRAGDIVTSISVADKIKSILQWKPQYNNLETIIRTAYEFEKNGFRK